MNRVVPFQTSLSERPVARRDTPRLMRIRYQILLGLMIGVALPALVRQFLFAVPFYVTTQIVTILGGAVALIAAYIIYRRLLIFPGISSGGYVITSVTATFGLLMSVMILMRLNYSRWQLLSCFLLSIGTLLFIHLRYERSRLLVLGYLPGGLTEKLNALPNVVWRRIEHPDDNLDEVNSIVVDLHHDHDNVWESAIAHWVLNGIQVYDARSALEQLTGKVSINHIFENTLGSLNPNAVYIKIKSTFDFIFALTIIIVSSPLLLMIAITIRLDSPGPAIFRQSRTGFRAKPFVIYKFRTMSVLADGEYMEEKREQAMTQSGDARVTRIGRFLRRSRIDELPQLFNVLKGEMSLIGPRPEARSLSQWYEKEISFYHYRHIIKPGISGWAQVNQGHVTDVNDIQEKLNLDFYYVKNYSFWLDMLIVLRTIAIMFNGFGAK